MPLDHAGPIAWDNSYAQLPAGLHARVAPTPVAAPRIIRVNGELATLLGLDAGALDAALLSGNRLPEGTETIAQAYSGHQFGHFSPSLGDGRAVLLGELVGTDGRRYDVQLKGSGLTPFSRGGDGRAALGPVLREYLLGEAMHALGIPTTRALAAVSTGQPVYRETVLPGAVLTRVAASHIRVGTFQFAAQPGAGGGPDAVRQLADYTIARHYPELAGDYRGLLDAVVARQAELIARWLLVGFIHGVMNTDNMAISGETIDYGPCAFMDAYDPATVFSSIDQAGRYAYGRQPQMAAWNLARLAEALLPLLGSSQETALASANEAIDGFAQLFVPAYRRGLHRKLGLQTEQEGDVELAEELLRHMQEGAADWTLTFRHLADAAEGEAAPVRALFSPGAAFDGWAERWQARLALEPGTPGQRAQTMRGLNPLYIPRNHLVDAALTAATRTGDFGPFEALLGVIAQPYEQRPGLERFALPPLPEERIRATFCGT